jgi:hypothetical protein
MSEHEGLIEYLPGGPFRTPYECRAAFAGGPILEIRQTLELAAQLEALALRLQVQALALRQMAGAIPKVAQFYADEED